MDALTLLEQDHRAVEALFEQVSRAGDDAERQGLVEAISEALSKHAAAEEQVLYPEARTRSAAKGDQLDEALEEHHVVKLLLAELEKLAPSSDRYAAKVRVLAESVRHHVEEEETQLFPALREALSDQQRNELGQALEQAKATAPTRPHPSSPLKPPFNLVAGPAAGLADKAMQVGKEVVGRAAEVVRGRTKR